MKKTILSLIAVIMFSSSFSQGKLLKKVMSKYNSALGNGSGIMEFYADAELTEPIEKISDGEVNFYVKAFIDKTAAGLCDNYSSAILTMEFDNARRIYQHAIETGAPLKKSAVDPGYIVYPVDFLDNEKGVGLLNIYLSEATEKRTYPLSFSAKCPGKNKIVSAGDFQMDLSNGNEQYVATFLKKFDDYTFKGKDAFKDDKLKSQIINHYKELHGVEVVNFAWGERVPYTSDDGKYNIRRHTAGVTYVENTSEKCYKAMLSVYDDAPWPSTNYTFDGQSTTLNNSEQIPCNRIGR